MKSNSYSAKQNDLHDLDSLSDKLKADLRRHIRALGSFPVLSEAWCEMAETMHRVAVISDAEALLPRDTPEATLWETEEGELGEKGGGGQKSRGDCC